jgi:toxin ParE1/3/4
VTPVRSSWRVRVTAAAETDLRDILQRTAEHFGQAQAHAYGETLSIALPALAARPTAIGVRRRNEIAKSLFSFHVAYAGRKGRHFLIFRVDGEQDATLEVLRVLHDSMDLPRHLQEGET